MEFPVISATVAAILLIAQQVLMLNVGLYRAKTKKGVGVDGDEKLERLSRRHGNLAENAAVFIITLTMLELLGGSSEGVYWLAVVFVVARLCHAIGFMSPAGSHLGEGSKLFLVLRSGGATMTALTGLATGALLLFSLLG